MRIVYLAICFILFSVASSALEIPSRPTGYVSDFAGILSFSDRQQIETVLRSHEQSTSNQIAVAIFNSLEGESLEDFSIRLADTWKIGQQGKNNGVILLIFTEDRKIRIEVGYGLEPYLTDALSDQIIRNVIAPQFKQGKYAQGILNGVNSIMAIVGGDTTGFTPSPSQHSHKKNNGDFGIIILILVLGALIDFLRYTFYFISNRAYHNRYSVLEWFFRFSILLFILKILASSRHSGGSRSSSGGFSGGGGRFGGGGASGGW
ncbi:TPM domain-containing protein [bacterium]|nr:TPM domain-containing protein [bacterium]